MRNIVGRKAAQYTGNSIFGGKRQKAAQRRLDCHNSENIDAKIELHI